MTTKQIDYCIEVARTLNFSRAADNLFVSQPTFSYQIRLLEEEVGFTIFERTGKGAALTPAGSQFVSFLATMREDLRRAIEQGGVTVDGEKETDVYAKMHRDRLSGDGAVLRRGKKKYNRVFVK